MLMQELGHTCELSLSVNSSLYFKQNTFLVCTRIHFLSLEDTLLNVEKFPVVVPNSLFSSQVSDCLLNPFMFMRLEFLLICIFMNHTNRMDFPS